MAPRPLRAAPVPRLEGALPATTSLREYMPGSTPKALRASGSPSRYALRHRKKRLATPARVSR